MTPANASMLHKATTGARVLAIIVNAMAGIAVVMFALMFLGVMP